MQPPLQPEQLAELMAGYALGDLTPEEMALLNQHLQAHPELVAEVNSLQETLALLPHALPESSPPPNLRSELLQATQIAAKKPIWSTPTAWLGIFGSVAAVLALVFGLDSYRLRQELAATQTQLTRQQDTIALLRQPHTRLVTLQGMATAQNASGSLVIAPNSQEFVITLKNLAPLPQGQVYRLWAMVNDQKVACGDFTPSSEGTVFVKFPLDENLAQAHLVVVTLEQSPKTPQSTGSMVMKSVT